MKGHLFSVWNKTQNAWATTTNYSTQSEALSLMRTIEQQCKEEKYEVRARPYGTIKD